MDVSGEHEVNAGPLEEGLEQAHSLLGVMFFGRVKGGVMEAHELPALL